MICRHWKKDNYLCSCLSLFTFHSTLDREHSIKLDVLLDKCDFPGIHFLRKSIIVIRQKITDKTAYEYVDVGGYVYVPSVVLIYFIILSFSTHRKERYVLLDSVSYEDSHMGWLKYQEFIVHRYNFIMDNEDKFVYVNTLVNQIDSKRAHTEFMFLLSGDRGLRNLFRKDISIEMMAGVSEDQAKNMVRSPEYREVIERIASIGNNFWNVYTYIILSQWNQLRSLKKTNGG